MNTTTFRLDDLTQQSCSAAIDQIAEHISSDLRSMIRMDNLWWMRLSFELPGRVLSEPDFFQLVDSYGPAMIPPLRRLWRSFAVALRTNGWVGFDAWYDDDVGALGYAALAYARLDPLAFELLETWLKGRDIGHEAFGRHVILPQIARKNGWSSKEAIEFGVRTIGREVWESSVGAMNDIGPSIRAAARMHFTPAAFADVVERIAHREAQSRLGNANDPEEFAYFRTGFVWPLVHGYDKSDAWDCQFFESVMPTGDWTVR